MKYQEMYTSYPLNRYIFCIWYLKGDSASSSSYGNQLLIPNETSEIVFNLADSFPDSLKRSVSDPYSSYIVGPITQTGSTCFQGEIELLGITFRPGMSFPFLTMNISELRNSILPLSLVWKDLSYRREELKNTSGLEVKLKIIEKEFIKKLKMFNDGKLNFKESFFSGINDYSSLLNVSTVQHMARTSGYSERTLERIFPRYTGLSPKEYLRIKRINNVAKMLLVEKKDMFEIISDNNYVDYSHLIKDLNHFDLRVFTSDPFNTTDFVSAYLSS